MKTNLIPLVCFVLLSAFADAQSTPRTPMLADRIRMIQVNHALLEDLLDHGIRLSDTDTHLGRAAECRKALVTIGGEVNRTVEQPAADLDRLSELADQMTQLTTEGLLPTLEAARAQIRAGSPGAEKLAKIETQTSDDLQTLLTGLTLDPRLNRNETLRIALDRLRSTLPSVKPVEK